MKSDILKFLEESMQKNGVVKPLIRLEYPENMEHGDFTTNAVMVSANRLTDIPLKSPVVRAKDICDYFNNFVKDRSDSLKYSLKAYSAGPGFINIKIDDRYFIDQIINAEFFDLAIHSESKNILIEYTDPNIFKVFHIGHLMSNAIGESLSRLLELSGHRITRICYPSDIGLHIAKSIWAMNKNRSEIPKDSVSIQEKTDFLGKMYVEGTNEYENNPKVKEEIDNLNKVIYEKSNEDINKLYDLGKKWSLEHFEILYKRLGTKFDDYIYESEMSSVGTEIVKSQIDKVFTESEGAIVFKGEDHGLHTRVFINSKGLPTYEAKEIGLNTTKFQKYPKTDESIIITASEQNDYFKVILKAFSMFDPNVSSKTKHFGHGMLRFASGKMSSRKGNVITAENLIDELRIMVKERFVGRDIIAGEADALADMIAIGAIKYTILRQSIGSDIIFDSKNSISFEGDSGPYLQYSAVRAKSLLNKAMALGIDIDSQVTQFPESIGPLEKFIVRFGDILERATTEMSPQIMANYLLNLATLFNSFYAGNTIASKEEPLSKYRLLMTRRFLEVMSKGLYVLGIGVPEKM
jgi:arginyl-tRNA synthetase